MARALCCLLLVTAIVAGCGEENTAFTTTTTSTTTTTLLPVDCPDPIAVSSTADLVAALEATPWRGVGGYTSGSVPITPDLVVTGTVTLEAADLPIPPDCLGRSDCRPQGGFSAGHPVQGVLLEGEVDLDCATGFSRLTVTNATLRLRPALRDTHPCRYNFIPLVAVDSPCGTACDPGTLMCPLDGSCYAAGDIYCRLCEGGTRQACACRGPEGTLPEGASCTYWESGDVRCDGTCRQGACATACD